MGSIGAPEIIIIAVVAILLFGATKLPIFAKSLGESLRIFKREIKNTDDDRADPRVETRVERRDDVMPQLPPVIADEGKAPTATRVETTRIDKTELR